MVSSLPALRWGQPPLSRVLSPRKFTRLQAKCSAFSVSANSHRAPYLWNETPVLFGGNSPTRVHTGPLQAFDTFVQQSFLDVIGGTGSCSDSRIQRALLRMSLPAPVGCSLFCSSDQARIAWWSSVSSCLSLEPLLFKLRRGLKPFAAFAFTSAVDMFGGVRIETRNL